MLQLATRRPAKTAAQRAEDQVLRLLADALPPTWLIIGLIPPRPFKSGRARTREMDAIIVAERVIFAIEIKSHGGRIRVRHGKPFQRNGAEITDRTNQPSGFWYHHEQSVYVLKRLLTERFAIARERVIPTIIWAGADSIDHGDTGLERHVTDVNSFAAIAVEEERRSRHAPLDRQLRSEIAGFLADEPAEVFVHQGGPPLLVDGNRLPPKNSQPPVASQQHSQPLPLPPRAPTSPPSPRVTWGFGVPWSQRVVNNAPTEKDRPARAAPVPTPVQTSRPPSKKHRPGRGRPLSLKEALGGLIPNSGQAVSVTIAASVEFTGPEAAKLVQTLADNHRASRILVIHPKGFDVRGYAWLPLDQMIQLCGQDRVGRYFASESWACHRPEQIVIADIGSVTSVANFPVEDAEKLQRSLAPFAFVVAIESDSMGNQLERLRPGPFTMLHISRLPNLSYVRKHRIPHLIGPLH